MRYARVITVQRHEKNTHFNENKNSVKGKRINALNPFLINIKRTKLNKIFHFQRNII